MAATVVSRSASNQLGGPCVQSWNRRGRPPHGGWSLLWGAYSMSSEPPPSTGLIAGKYELLGMIGRGGMGSVWEGRHASLGTRVAIKFIESEYTESQEARSRFDNEARAAATIQSKHAIQIFDHGVTHDGKPYIVM